jgi:hypothetical protein
MKQAKIAPPTLEQMRREAPWTWVNCTNTKCHHRMPVAITPLIIRWGPDASSDQLRASARCAKCGRKGATLTGPSWGGMDVGVLPFPKNW